MKAVTRKNKGFKIFSGNWARITCFKFDKKLCLYNEIAKNGMIKDPYLKKNRVLSPEKKDKLRKERLKEIIEKILDVTIISLRYFLNMKDITFMLSRFWGM